jgi:hypothetical protein
MHQMVEMLEKIHRFEILVAAVLVGHPFAGLARVVQVQHRSDRVHAQPVNVKAVAPEQRVGGQKIADLVAAVIEDQRAPILVRPLARVFVLVKGRAVKAGQRPFVAREMRRHPVHEHPDAGLVQGVDQVLEIIRRAKPAGRRVEAGHLVAPRRIIGVLADRQEFHMRKTHFADVVNQRPRQLAVVQRLRHILLLPGTGVDFVDADGRLERIPRGPLLHPFLVGPLEPLIVPDNAGVLGRDLEEKAVGIGPQRDVSVRVLDFEFVMRARAHAGDENLPDPGQAQQPHRVKPPVPLVEIAHHAHPPGVGGPKGERRAGHAVHGLQLRAQLGIDPLLVALIKQIEVGFAQRREKGVRVPRLAGAALAVGDDQVVGIDLRGQRAQALEHPGRVDQLQGEGRLVLLVGRRQFDFGGVGNHCARHHPGAIPQRMQAEQLVRRGMLQLDQTQQFGLGQYHSAASLP